MFCFEVAFSGQSDIILTWKRSEPEMMHRSLGGDGQRCHALELSAGFQARKKVRFEMPCYKCGNPVSLTRSRAQVYREGIARGSMGPGKGYGFGHAHCPRVE